MAIVAFIASFKQSRYYRAFYGLGDGRLSDSEQVTVDAAKETNEQVAERKAKLAELRQQGNAYPNDFKRDALSADLHAEYESKDAAALEANPVQVKIAGRMLTRRVMGKASFAHIQDMSGKMQLYVARDNLPEGVYAAFKRWDLGDIVGASGVLFRTKTNELSVKVTAIKLLTKSLRPMPDKFHGLADQEQRFRQRYLDLIANEEVREIFRVRSKIIGEVRRFLDSRSFVEVETPMMQAQAGGAIARPFMTHHNALDMELYMRVAPELYLKRLVVGGFEKVYELNRNFRNEGVSTRHNPEFTMLEFYQAYADYEDMMDLTEVMFRELAKNVLGTTKLNYQGIEIDFAKPFRRLSMLDSIVEYHPEIKLMDLQDLNSAKAAAEKVKLEVHDSWGLGKIQFELFEHLVEENLSQPTFITAHPAEVSPLARANDQDPTMTDRFELYIGGREIANAFSELNDPEDQAQRFEAQLKARDAGDSEAMTFDEDYIAALEYGLPPTAGEGIGIDRLVMLFTDSASIRDVILFPLLRRKR
ncbi:MAG: lysine--tRNA ligase [Gammaproteobacteria bacterium]|nr:lysine--tRNA ligase [Gammaproteobacteria bacterium]